MTQPLAAVISEISTTQNTDIKILSGPLKGGSNTIYEIQSKHGDHWSLRIPHDVDAAAFAIKGTAVLKDAKEKCPGLLAPTIIHQSQYYKLMEYLDGEALKSWNTQVLPKERREVILDGIANFLYTLWTLEDETQNTKPKITYKKYLQNEVDKVLLRKLKENSTWGDPIHYLHRRVKIDSLVPYYPDDGVTILKHGDLNAWNVIINKKGLSGVIDWDTSRFTPAPSAIQHPLFIANIPGWLNDNVTQDMTFEEDRSYLEYVIGKLDATGRIEYLLKTSFERQFLEMVTSESDD